MPSDEDTPGVIDAARRGDRAAWELLYRRLYPKLRPFLIRRVGTDGAEDALSETMARAIASIGGYSPGAAGFDGWVFGIARHVVADHHRRRARDLRHADVVTRLERAGPQGAVPVGERLDRLEEHARLRAMFSLLGPAEREILELRVVAGLSPEQVGAVLGRRPGAVRTAQSRALAHLRRLMEASHVDA